MKKQTSLGNEIHLILSNVKGFLFDIGRKAQLAYDAFNSHVDSIKKKEEKELTFQYPLGLRPDGSTIPGNQTMTKEQFLAEYQFIATYTLPMNAITNLVLGIEMMVEDVVSKILMHFPKKIGVKKQIPISTLFEYKSIEEARTAGIKNILIELFYSSPKDVAETLETIFSFSLLDIPQFQKYIEIKATRDIHIHNRGVANEVYLRKAESLARVDIGKPLPITIQYFLQSLEVCLQLIESLETRFHSIWPSTDLEKERRANKTLQPTPSTRKPRGQRG